MAATALRGEGSWVVPVRRTAPWDPALGHWGRAWSLLPGFFTATLVCRDNAEGVLARAAAFLGLEPSAAQLAAAGHVRANRGHDTRSAVPGCGSRQHSCVAMMHGACDAQLSLIGPQEWCFTQLGGSAPP